ncbi:DUF4395 domain-containing protein [Sulfurimonas sp.]|jgi:hypothetical protein|uniref:DUF4395 domain-containing protein n=1 Tax=Sulfurimonas sp. TaxID=2022749 RepID=UPI0025EA3D63|nr:DUF4395 domain-containing protein [Sulfurimonas sp.]MCK9472532.1 DUF4395 domain-containing protein [Sulfurimonas sp.]MDD3505122.1 DUF4395 domain-containing protein [Sulfurimonas sp.]
MLHIQSSIQNIVDENQTRVHAGVVLLFMSAYLFSANELFIYILIYDFLVRVYAMPFMSPIYLISTVLVKLFNQKERLTDGSAKEFASHVGLSMLFAVLIADLLNETTAAFFLTIFLALWKIAEVAKDYCFACKFYELLKSKNIEVESL